MDILVICNELRQVIDFCKKYVAFFLLLRLLVLFFLKRKKQFTTMDGVAERLSKLKLDESHTEQIREVTGDFDSDCDLTSDVESASDEEAASSNYDSDGPLLEEAKKIECYCENL